MCVKVLLCTQRMARAEEVSEKEQFTCLLTRDTWSLVTSSFKDCCLCCVHFYVCVCVCVGVREREKEKEKVCVCESHSGGESYWPCWETEREGGRRAGGALRGKINSAPLLLLSYTHDHTQTHTCTQANKGVG